MARQFRLGFAPLMEERFDLVVDRRAYFEPPLQRLLTFTRGPAFAAKAAEMGGYDVSAHGRVVWNGA
jgi:molybdate-binding protein